MGRANYRQTCVDFRDGILQSTWHELNQFLRLTGVGCAGIVMWEHHKDANKLQQIRKIAQDAVNSMAQELNLPLSKAVTTCKPDGCTLLETKIKTDKGVLSLEDIFLLSGYTTELISQCEDKTWLDINEPLKVFDENNEQQSITKLYVRGESEVFNITFEDGHSYSFTGNHKLKTNSGWKRVDELTCDDEVISF